ncbi:MAG: hypothetical protein K8R73_06325 [Clostridiales bacterium]|nr:hypothetical protein [Clostridiales bacterium]
MKKVFSNYQIKEIERSTANDLFRQHHYTGTFGVSTFSLGLFKDGELIGAISYGPSCAPSMAKSISSLLTNSNYLELQRLFIFDVTEKNTESWFIGQSFKKIRIKYPEVKVIISFADPNAGHQGTIYQATNFLYLGLSTKYRVLVNNDTNEEKHPRSIQRLKKSGSEKYEDYINNGHYITKEGKHRYLHILDDKIRYYIEKSTGNYVSKIYADQNFTIEQVKTLFVLDESYYVKTVCMKISAHLKREVLPYPKNKEIDDSSI